MAVTMKQVRSSNRASGRQRDTLRSLGLGRIGRVASHDDTPQLRGMLRVVEHLVEVNGDSSDSGSGSKPAGAAKRGEERAD